MDEELNEAYGGDPFRCCLTCSRSMSADDEFGRPILVCAINEYKIVEEYEICDDYN